MVQCRRKKHSSAILRKLSSTKSFHSKYNVTKLLTYTYKIENKKCLVVSISFPSSTADILQSLDELHIVWLGLLLSKLFVFAL